MNEITITFPDGSKKKYPKGITYFEISKDKKRKKSILGVKVDNEINALDNKAMHDASIEFFDVKDLAGYKMYQSALKFIFEVSVKELFPESEIHFLHSVPKGILSEVLIPENFTNEEVKKIKGKMAEIISSKEIFQKYNLFKKDAYNYFMSIKEEEKAKNIQNISKSNHRNPK